MKKIENMLLGIGVLLVTIIMHLSVEALLLTDFLGIIGVIILIASYNSKDNDKN
ncbi:hypothetical protein [Lachnoclostridium phytofermentans]|uniref:hypothetical protein n=1 Tax=Lachnoclostridium phytofermentans TaxID=66219 RepID=UPI0002D36BCF|nr:hypothetical protein [Lachnoclostridium phytofermentans]